MGFFLSLTLMILLKQFSLFSSAYVPGQFTVTPPSGTEGKCENKSDGAFSSYCKQQFPRTHYWFPTPISDGKTSEVVDEEFYNIYSSVHSLIDPSPLEKKCQLISSFLLCSSFYPYCCNDRKPLIPCFSYCNETRTLCEPLMIERGFEWPKSLNCNENFPVESAFDETETCKCVQLPQELRVMADLFLTPPPTTPSESTETVITPSSNTSSSVTDERPNMKPTHRGTECPRCALVRDSVSAKGIRSRNYFFAFRVKLLNASYAVDHPYCLIYTVNMTTDYALSCEDQIERGTIIDVYTNDCLGCRSNCNNVIEGKEYLIMGNKNPEGKYELKVTRSNGSGGCVISDWLTKDYATKLKKWITQFKPCDNYKRNIPTE